jgi:hypothetical protein
MEREEFNLVVTGARNTEQPLQVSSLKIKRLD